MQLYAILRRDGWGTTDELMVLYLALKLDELR